MILDRSLKDGKSYCNRNDISRLIILERLKDGGYFQNNRRMFVKFDRRNIARLMRVICSMNNLEKLHFLECNLTLTEDLPQVFQSCPKLTVLHIQLSDPNRVERERLNEMNEHLKNELRSGFQRLVELHCVSYSCPAFQEIFL
jgi:hypothetical protein